MDFVVFLNESIHATFEFGAYAIGSIWLLMTLYLHQCNSFVRASPKRIIIWKDVVNKLSVKYGDIDKRIRPGQSNTTRWWSNIRLLNNVCKNVSCYLNFFINLTNLNILIADKTIQCTVNQKEIFPKNFNEWSKDLKSLIILHVVRKILNQMHETMVFLQSSALPMSEMVPSILSCHKYLKSNYMNENEKLSELLEESYTFADSILRHLVTEDVQNMILATTELPFTINDEDKNEVFLLIQSFLKQLLDGIEKRFLTEFDRNPTFFQNIATLSPSKLLKISEGEKVTLHYLCGIVDLNHKKTVNEFKEFAREFINHTQRQQSHLHERNANETNNEEQDEDVQNEYSVSTRDEWLILKNFLSENQAKYKNVHTLYQFALTLPCTQVESERSFSVMGNIKTSSRSSLSDESLESYMVIDSCTDSGILSSKSFPKIVDEIGKSAKYLEKRLIYAN